MNALHHYLAVTGGIEPDIATFTAARDRDAARDAAHAEQDPDSDAMFSLDAHRTDDGARLSVDGGPAGGAGLYVLVIEGGIHAELVGRFPDEDARQAAARTEHDRTDPATDAVLWLDFAPDLTVAVGTFSGAFFDPQTG